MFNLSIIIIVVIILQINLGFVNPLHQRCLDTREGD